MATLPGMDGRTVTLGSLSKSHAMAGWRVGWAIAPASVTGAVSRVVTDTTNGIPGFVQAGAIEAFRDYQGYATTTRDTFRARRDMVMCMLAGMDMLDVVLPDAGMFVLLDTRHARTAPSGFTRHLYDATGVALLDAGAFGSSTCGFSRLSLSVPERELVPACGRIRGFVASLG